MPRSHVEIIEGLGEAIATLGRLERENALLADMAAETVVMLMEAMSQSVYAKRDEILHEVYENATRWREEHFDSSHIVELSISIQQAIINRGDGPQDSGAGT